MQTFASPLRVLYAAGPGDVINTYRHWQQGHDDPSQVAITYSHQFFDVCQQLNAQAYVISSHPDRNLIQDQQFVIEHRPLQEVFGLRYHWSQLRYGLSLIHSAIRFRANVAVISSGTTHWFILSLLTLLGIEVIPSLHCVLWRKYGGPKGSQKLINYLDRWFFRLTCRSILAVSQDAAEQISQLTHHQHRPIVPFRPTYRSQVFQKITASDLDSPVFRVLYVGRIEEEKGVWDILAMAQNLVQQGHTTIVFDVCGDGSHLADLKVAIERSGLSEQVICHGHCDRDTMRAMFSQAHVILVPTRKEFVEGFNKVVAEGILASRPIVTSDVCPALNYVRDAVVEVPPENIAAYVEAILRLWHDRSFYQQKQQATHPLQGQFYHYRQSWGYALKTLLQPMSQSARSGLWAAKLPQFFLPSR